MTTDPKLKAELKKLADKFRDAKEELTKNTNNALSHPNDKQAQEKFNQAVQHCKNINNDAVLLSHPNLENDLLDNGKNIGQKMQDMLDKLAQNDKEAALKILDELEKDMRRQQIMCKAMAAKVSDPTKRKQLLDAAMNLQNMLSSLAGPFREMLMKKGGEQDAMEFLNKLMNDTYKVNQKIENSLREEVEEEEEEPRDEIMQAARHVEKVVKMKGTHRKYVLLLML